MYEKHFGLEKRPFSVKATGGEVFVGPQTAKTMDGFRKALAVQDAVVTVSGPAGAGKTTLVERALNAIGSKYKTVRVGRVKMNSSDILEALLIVLGVQERPNGTIQRFAALRRKLQQLQDAETRVFILVEDAVHAGTETLAELEALTDAEAGESDGAGIVLMGDERLFDFMRQPELVRLQQRVRRRHRIQPLGIPEMLGYLRHGLRTAGGDYERIFDSRSAEVFHRLSEGIPRVANNLVDAVLVAAAKGGMDKIPASFVAEIVSEEFGLTADGFDFSTPDPVEDLAPVPAPNDRPKSAPEDAPRPAEPATEVAAEVTAEPVAYEAPDPLTQLTEQSVIDDALKRAASEEWSPVIAAADEAAAAPAESQDVPHLINDTLPDLSVLSERYATLSQDECEAPAEIVAETGDVSRDVESQTPAVHLDEEEISADADTIVAEDADDLTDGVPGLEPEPQIEPLEESVPDIALESQASLEPVPEFEAKSELLTQDVPVLDAEPEPSPTNVPVLDPAPESSPELVAKFTAEFEPQAIAEAEDNAESIPELKPAVRTEPEPAAESARAAEQRPVLEIVPDDAAPATAGTMDGPDLQDPTPEWDRDPTFAQLKPDLDALEQAMAYTHGEALEAEPQTPPEPESLAASIDEHEDDDLPEITLDKSIETGIQNQLSEASAAIPPPERARKTDVELGQIAASIANAKTLEDIDDIMAETLFGTSISMVAAAIKANPPSDDSANDELQILEEEPMAGAVPPPESPAAGPVREEISIETPAPAGNTGLDASASQRLKTVRALNANLHPSLQARRKAAPNPSSPAVSDEPQPIEDQINTSITQTLQALKVPPDMEDEEPEEEQKSGFFSRFRRSK